MSNNIKVQISKAFHESKLESLIKSYNSLMSILSPNLSENNNTFMSHIIELIISQLKFFVKLLSLKEDKKTFEMLNSNNQNLSKQIAVLYEFHKYQLNTKLSLNTTSEKDRNENNLIFNNKESNSLEDKKENINKKIFDNFELNFDNNTESKMIENDEFYEKKNNAKNQNMKGKNEKLIKKNINKEKNELLSNLNFRNDKNNKTSNVYGEKVKNIRVKTQNRFKKDITTKNKRSEKETKITINKKILFSKNSSKKHLNTIKSNKYELPSFNIETKTNKNYSKTGYKEFKDKTKEKYSKINNKMNTNENKKESIKIIKNNNNCINDNLNEQNNEEEKFEIIEENDDNKTVNLSPKKFERKGRKSKTVIFKSIQIPYLIGIETSENGISPKDNYISITFSNKVLDSVKTPDNRNQKHKLFNLKTFDQKNLYNTEIKKENKLNLNSQDYFSLDEFLIKNENENGEILFLTKNGKVLINQKQKDILEDYVNNYLFDEDDDNNSNEIERMPLTNIGIKEKINSLKKQSNKDYVIKGTSMRYNLKDVTELLQILPHSFKVPLNDFYLRKKKASMFNRDIFKICHKVIDNYKILEGKEDIFQNKRSKSKPKYNINKKNMFEKNISKYQNRNYKIYNNNMYSN